MIHFTFLKISEDMTTTNSANTVKLRDLIHFASNPEIFFLVHVFMSLHFSRTLN